MRHLKSLVARMARAERMSFDSGMIALVPSSDSAALLAHHSPEALSPDDLHVTIQYLGPTAEWTVPDQAKLIESIGEIAEAYGSVPGVPWAVASLNPNSEHACVAYIVSGAEMTQVHDKVLNRTASLDLSVDIPLGHEPWVPHITLGYGLDPRSVNTAPTGQMISFDRLRIGFSENYRDYPL